MPCCASKVKQDVNSIHACMHIREAWFSACADFAHMLDCDMLDTACSHRMQSYVVTCLLTLRSFKAAKFSACSQFPKYNRSGIISPGYLQNKIMHSMPTVMCCPSCSANACYDCMLVGIPDIVQISPCTLVCRNSPHCCICLDRLGAQKWVFLLKGLKSAL